MLIRPKVEATIKVSKDTRGKPIKDILIVIMITMVSQDIDPNLIIEDHTMITIIDILIIDIMDIGIHGITGIIIVQDTHNLDSMVIMKNITDNYISFLMMELTLLDSQLVAVIKMKRMFIVIILILLLISGCLFVNKSKRDQAHTYCTNYTNNKQIMKPEDLTNQEIYERCMEIYGYGKE